MSKVKIGIQQGKKGLAGSALGILGSLAGLILYIVTATGTNKDISILIVSVSVVGTALALLSLLLLHLDGMLSILSASTFLFAMCMFVSSQADSIGYAAAGSVDIGYGIQPTLVTGCIFYLLAVVGECLAVFDGKKTA